MCEILKDATMRYGHLDDQTNHPFAVMIRLFKDSVSSRIALNDYAEGILDETLRHFDKS